MIQKTKPSVSLIIPSYNNLKHLKNAYTSIQKHAYDCELILLDDGSTDGTWEWMQDKDCIKYRSETRVGHTILYDKGIELATNEIVGILHADMIIGPNYIENLVKHIKPGKVVCATRVEPPLHPEGKEKIIQDFGQDFDTLNINGFEHFCSEWQPPNYNVTTKGMFAPWIIYKSDFEAIGGHDPLFAPFPYEDSDIFQRWILAGYELIQSRDSFVYHLTCRGHRWNEQVGKDDEYYKEVSRRAARNYLRKWGSWIENDEYQYPKIKPKYDIGFVVHNCTLAYLEMLEPYCSNIYVKEGYTNVGYFKPFEYIEIEQPSTSFNLSERIKDIGEARNNNIIVEFDVSQLTRDSCDIIQSLPSILHDSGEIGVFEIDIFKITINSLNTFENDLVVCKK